uniref:Uncharacterized protein n=1 Tax=Cacopsylla melanoneura TaxID=428564 RepID=A0A8D8U0Z2_9HEMI
MNNHVFVVLLSTYVEDTPAIILREMIGFPRRLNIGILILCGIGETDIENIQTNTALEEGESNDSVRNFTTLNIYNSPQSSFLCRLEELKEEENVEVFFEQEKKEKEQ